jgi:MFS family permease
MAYFKRQIGQQQPDGSYALSSGDNSLITSILSAGTFFGALGAAPIANKLGRRYGIMVYLILFSIGVGMQTGGTSEFRRFYRPSSTQAY